VRARSLCLGCKRAPAVDHGRCSACLPAYLKVQRQRTDDKRGSASARGYGAAWSATAAAFLAAAGHRCAIPGCHRRASVADHYPRTRRELVDAGVTDPDAWHRLRPLCRHHHDTIGPRTPRGPRRA